MLLKEAIKKTLYMQDIARKYNIRVQRDMCKCPFHNDKTASMKLYAKSFYCFACHKTGDFIQFVQFMHNLNFQEAMEKINYDFNLGFQTRGILDTNKIEELNKREELRRLQEQAKKDALNKRFIELTDKLHKYNRLIEKTNKEVTILNWEEKVTIISYFQLEVGKLEMQIDEEFLNEK